MRLVPTSQLLAPSSASTSTHTRSSTRSQGYRNRYDLIDSPSGSCNFCEVKKVSDFETLKDF